MATADIKMDHLRLQHPEQRRAERGPTASSLDSRGGAQEVIRHDASTQAHRRDVSAPAAARVLPAAQQPRPQPHSQLPQRQEEAARASASPPPESTVQYGRVRWLRLPYGRDVAYNKPLLEAVFPAARAAALLAPTRQLAMRVTVYVEVAAAAGGAEDGVRGGGGGGGGGAGDVGVAGDSSSATPVGGATGRDAGGSGSGNGSGGGGAAVAAAVPAAAAAAPGGVQLRPYHVGLHMDCRQGRGVKPRPRLYRLEPLSREMGWQGVWGVRRGKMVLA